MANAPWSYRFRHGVLVAGLFVFVYASLMAASQTGYITATPEQAATFESKVRPVLVAKCYACHGEKQQIAGLRLDKPISPAMAKKVADAVRFTGATKMPPSGKLPAQELAALAAWGKAGGPWPSKTVSQPKKEFWAFSSPELSQPPKVKNKAWVQSPIDQFVLAKLEQKGMAPAQAADKLTLIRRATFDLTGLPPSPEEIDAFLADKSPLAFAKVVDRLLGSTAYGERWGRHWLDVARYADSNGLDENLVYHNAWRYRDYVIAAMNQDLPINQFFTEQIAGDLLPNATDSQIIATGYLALGGKMLAEDDPQKQELDIIDEQVDTLTKGMLAMTVGCARCHDHKFDPITAKDYYSMAGIFKSTKTMDKFTVVAEWQERPIGPKEPREKLKAISASIKEKEKARDKIRAEEREALMAKIAAQKDEYEAAAKADLQAEKVAVSLKPALRTRGESIPAGSILLEAERFTGGNVTRDDKQYGIGIGIIHNSGVYPNFAEYSVNVATAGFYQIDFRYASAENRAIRVYINHKIALPVAASKPTGGFYPQHQAWVSQGIVELLQGENLVKLERDSYFPHIDQILFSPSAISEPTYRPVGNLISEVVATAVGQLKAGGKIKLELPQNADHLFPAEKNQEVVRLNKEIKDLEASKPEIPHAMAVSEAPPKTLKIHQRGSYLTLGEDTTRGVPAVLAKSNPISIPANRSGRLELANWITDPKNPLTARVFVNRVWRWRFGRGLVSSVDNFGILGDLPSHPELLNWLANTFVTQDKWSLKSLHRRMMLSSTYQMSTKFDAKYALTDPDNRFLWRFNRKRLEAEAIRDSILFVSGTLDRKIRRTMMNFPPRAYVTSTESKQTINYDVPRRSVYLPVVRAAVYDVYTAFDFGDPTVMNGDRPSTTVAPQALFMLNAPIVLNSTKIQAKNLLGAKSLSPAQRVRTIYRTCYGRAPNNAEVERALMYIEKFKAAYLQSKSKEPELDAWQSLCKSIIASNEFIYVE